MDKILGHKASNCIKDTSSKGMFGGILTITHNDWKEGLGSAETFTENAHVDMSVSRPYSWACGWGWMGMEMSPEESWADEASDEDGTRMGKTCGMCPSSQHLESRGRKTGGQSQPGMHNGSNKTIKGRKSGHRE